LGAISMRALAVLLTSPKAVLLAPAFMVLMDTEVLRFPADL
jgi:hypothetical protein